MLLPVKYRTNVVGGHIHSRLNLRKPIWSIQGGNLWRGTNHPSQVSKSRKLIRMIYVLRNLHIGCHGSRLAELLLILFAIRWIKLWYSEQPGRCEFAHCSRHSIEESSTEYWVIWEREYERWFNGDGGFSLTFQVHPLASPGPLGSDVRFLL